MFLVIGSMESISAVFFPSMFANKYHELWIFLTTSVPTMTEGTEDCVDKNFFINLMDSYYPAYHMSLFGNQPQLSIKKVFEIYLLYKCLER